jgi:hypothetical protein
MASRGEAHAPGDGLASLRSMACAVRGNDARPPPLAAERFIERARRLAESLELGVASANGVLLQKGERYRRKA